MLKIAVLGDRQTVVGFKALGLAVFPVADAEEARRTFRQITRPGEDYAIIYGEESFAEALQREIDRFKDSPNPAVILIPGLSGNTGECRRGVEESVEKAVGSKLV